MYTQVSYNFFPLSESAVLISFGEVMNEEISKQVLSTFTFLQNKKISFITGIVPAYTSLTVHYNFLALQHVRRKDQTGFDVIVEFLEKILEKGEKKEEESRLIRVPVCYEPAFAPDLYFLAHQKQITVDEVIDLHMATVYRVYMIGFLPGFAYMGEVDEKIASPRKQQPAMVAAGSVGIAGKQTGIYPLASPGGWNIIGRTPLKLFDAAQEEPVLLQPGDAIQFYPITAHEFAHY